MCHLMLKIKRLSKDRKIRFHIFSCTYKSKLTKAFTSVFYKLIKTIVIALYDYFCASNSH